MERSINRSKLINWKETRTFVIHCICSNFAESLENSKDDFSNTYDNKFAMILNKIFALYWVIRVAVLNVCFQEMLSTYKSLLE